MEGKLFIRKLRKAFPELWIGYNRNIKRIEIREDIASYALIFISFGTIQRVGEEEIEGIKEQICSHITDKTMAGIQINL